MTAAEFEVDITESDARRFAELSGDWNPLHTDPMYAAETSYRRPILHGAFSAGLLSRMADMFIPGRDCLLHGIKLKFISPILPPAYQPLGCSEFWINSARSTACQRRCAWITARSCVQRH